MLTHIHIHACTHKHIQKEKNKGQLMKTGLIEESLSEVKELEI